MIRHIVMFSAKRKEDLDTIEYGLNNLTQIPGDFTIEITRNQKADQLGNDIDIVVYGEFKDIETLETYKSHPLYEKSTSIVRPLRELRVAADIETTPAQELKASA